MTTLYEHSPLFIKNLTLEGLKIALEQGVNINSILTRKKTEYVPYGGDPQYNALQFYLLASAPRISLDILEHMVCAGINLNYENKSKSTVLSLWLNSDSILSVSLKEKNKNDAYSNEQKFIFLLKNGADPLKKNSEGKNVFEKVFARWFYTKDDLQKQVLNYIHILLEHAAPQLKVKPQILVNLIKVLHQTKINYEQKFSPVPKELLKNYGNLEQLLHIYQEKIALDHSMSPIAFPSLKAMVKI